MYHAHTRTSTRMHTRTHSCTPAHAHFGARIAHSHASLILELIYSDVIFPFPLLSTPAPFISIYIYLSLSRSRPRSVLFPSFFPHPLFVSFFRGRTHTHTLSLSLSSLSELTHTHKQQSVYQSRTHPLSHSPPGPLQHAHTDGSRRDGGDDCSDAQQSAPWKPA